jgi:hypothetical protein
MKQKTIVLIILIFIATTSSFLVLASEGYFDSKKIENKVLAVEQKVTSTPIVLASETTATKKPVIAKKTPTVKKAPVKKKVVKKKTVKRKSKLNLSPAVFTPETAPYSAKNSRN